MSVAYQSKRIDNTYTRSLLLALIFSLVNMPLTLRPYLNLMPVIASGFFGLIILILFALRRRPIGRENIGGRILFLLAALVFLVVLNLLAAKGVNLNFYLLPVIAGGIFLLSDTRILGSIITATALIIFVLLQLFSPGGWAVIGSIPLDELVAAARMNLTGAGLMFVLIMVLVTREFSRSEVNLDAERQKNADMLRTLYPDSVLNRMLSGETFIAERCSDVSILFCDLVGFTAMSRQTDPAGLVRLLNDLYSDMDHVAARHRVEKIKTIGDSYMAVAGISGETNHVTEMAEFALEVRRLLAEKYPEIGVRIGIHCGEVMAGILGLRKQSFDIWGDAVNLASRLESSATRNQILCSADFAVRLPAQIGKRSVGMVELKGVGMTERYEVLS